MLKLKPKYAPSLKERIDEIEREVAALVAEQVAIVKKECPNLPLGVIENQIRMGHCPCRVAKRLVEGD